MPVLSKKGIMKSLWVDLLCLLGSGRATMLPLGTLSLGLLVIAVDPAFIAAHQNIKNCGIWIDKLGHLPAVMTTSFFLIFSEHPWDKLRANLPHLQFLANNCVYSSHTDIKRCTYCLYRHTTVLIHEILYLANQLYCSDFLNPPTPLIIPHRLPAFLETQKLMLDQCKMLQKQSEAFYTFLWHFFPSLKENFIAYRSSKVSDCIFEIRQLWIIFTIEMNYSSLHFKNPLTMIFTIKKKINQLFSTTKIHFTSTYISKIHWQWFLL